MHARSPLFHPLPHSPQIGGFSIRIPSHWSQVSSADCDWTPHPKESQLGSSLESHSVASRPTKKRAPDFFSGVPLSARSSASNAHAPGLTRELQRTEKEGLSRLVLSQKHRMINHVFGGRFCDFIIGSACIMTAPRVIGSFIESFCVCVH
jgi:hypothetical protein